MWFGGRCNEYSTANSRNYSSGWPNTVCDEYSLNLARQCIINSMSSGTEGIHTHQHKTTNNLQHTISHSHAAYQQLLLIQQLTLKPPFQYSDTVQRSVSVCKRNNNYATDKSLLRAGLLLRPSLCYKFDILIRAEPHYQHTFTPHLLLKQYTLRLI